MARQIYASEKLISRNHAIFNTLQYQLDANRRWNMMKYRAENCDISSYLVWIVAF